MPNVPSPITTVSIVVLDVGAPLVMDTSAGGSVSDEGASTVVRLQIWQLQLDLDLRHEPGQRVLVRLGVLLPLLVDV
jgi:hypothetical protein